MQSLLNTALALFQGYEGIHHIVLWLSIPIFVCSNRALIKRKFRKFGECLVMHSNYVSGAEN